MAATERTTKEVVGDAQVHLRELVEAHIDLAKAEMAQAQKEVAGAVVPLVVAGVLGLFLLGFAGVTGAKVLEIWLVEWAAWLIVTGVLTLVVVLLGLAGRRRIATLDAAPKLSKESVKDTVGWAKGLTGRNA